MKWFLKKFFFKNKQYTGTQTKHFTEINIRNKKLIEYLLLNGTLWFLFLSKSSLPIYVLVLLSEKQQKNSLSFHYDVRHLLCLLWRRLVKLTTTINKWEIIYWGITVKFCANCATNNLFQKQSIFVLIAVKFFLQPMISRSDNNS